MFRDSAASIDASRTADSILYLLILHETREGLTPDHESGFVRSLLESASAKGFNAFSDDGNAFRSALKARCGDSARDYEVTDGTDILCIFPSLASDVTATSLRRELQNPDALQSGYIDQPTGEWMLLSHCALTLEVRLRSSKIA
jgi:hypothetical protein